MKNKLQKVCNTLAFGLIMLFLVNVAFGQSQMNQSSDEKQTLATNANSTPLNITSSGYQKKTSNGGIIIDQNGTVQVPLKNADGTTEVKTFAKPTINLKSQDKGADMKQFELEFKAWLSHNSEGLNYLSQGEKDALGNGNVSALYLYNYAQAMEKTKTTH